MYPKLSCALGDGSDRKATTDDARAARRGAGLDQQGSDAVARLMPRRLCLDGVHLRASDLK